jgi:hypothetical protein
MRRACAVVGACLWACLSAWASAEVRVLPLLRTQLTASRSSFEGESTGIQGQFNLDVTPVTEFGDNLSLVPNFRTTYRGHAAAVAVNDEKTLFQAEHQYGLDLSLLYRFLPNWKLALVSGASNVRYKETADEGWGEGLYDHRSHFVGVHLEARTERGRPAQWRAGAERSTVLFPNYDFLDPSVGRRPEDADAWRGFLRVQSALTRSLTGQCELAAERETFREQKVIGTDLLPGGRRRRDAVFTLKNRWDYLVPGRGRLRQRWSLAIDARARRSNQNLIDNQIPGQPVLVENFVAYNEGGLSPQVSLRWGPTDTALAAGVGATRRVYVDRRAQDADGRQAGRPLRTWETYGFLNLSHPVVKNLRAVAGATWVKSRSNSDFQSGARYDYRSADVSLGLSYEF